VNDVDVSLRFRGAATTTPEARGLARDGVRLLVTTPAGHRHYRFHDLPRLLAPGTLLLVNRSATLAASLPARAGFGDFILNLSTRYGPRLWLAEPRRDRFSPGPLALAPGDRVAVAGLSAKIVSPYPGTPRLFFFAFDGDVERAMAEHGQPIRYGYLAEPLPPLEEFQTIFASAPGGAEMPSAARPFTPALVGALARSGVQIEAIELHAAVSSLDEPSNEVGGPPPLPEPFRVPAATAAAINDARRDKRPVIAVGTTVVRAVETAASSGVVRAASGFTRLVLGEKRRPQMFDGMITGFHDATTTHADMLAALAGRDLVDDAYRVAAADGYLWHEFGDSHLLLR
jgi:S-adenosylmethionine:tRNA ribosyltransferase-isomerase